MIDWPPKGPTEVADYEFDFSAVLAEGEAIATRVVTAAAVTVDSSAIVGIDGGTDNGVQVWLSGGAAGVIATVTCTIVTDSAPARTFSELAVLPIGGGPIDIARAKAHVKVDWADPDNDTLIAAYLRASVAAVERRVGRPLAPQAFTEWAPRFPWCLGERLTLARDPVTTIVSVIYVDSDGAEQALDPAGYRSIEGEPWSLIAPINGSFPQTEERPDAVRVRYIAGYEAGQCPPDLQAAVLLMLGHLYLNREAVAVGANVVTELPLAVQALCDPFRRVGL
jgi:uncharacterized phiE125 gp8 family phage protein